MLDEKEHFMNGKEELKNKNLKPKRFRETTKFKKFQKIMVFWLQRPSHEAETNNNKGEAKSNSTHNNKIKTVKQYRKKLDVAKHDFHFEKEQSWHWKAKLEKNQAKKLVYKSYKTVKKNYIPLHQ